MSILKMVLLMYKLVSLSLTKPQYEEPSEPLDPLADYLSSEYSLQENEIKKIMNQVYYEEFQIKEEKRQRRNERAKYLRGLSEEERERERDPRGRRPTKANL